MADLHHQRPEVQFQSSSPAGTNAWTGVSITFSGIASNQRCSCKRKSDKNRQPESSPDIPASKAISGTAAFKVPVQS